ncbi:unnamed protein product, partial [Linum tenue]
AGTSTNGASPTSTLTSPAGNLTREYTFAVQTDSYKELWSRIHIPDDYHHSHQIELEEDHLLMAQVLHPDGDSVAEALRHAKPSTLTRLVSAYFTHSEETTRLCLLLHRSVHRARAMYHPLHRLLQVLPLNHHLSGSQCDAAFDAFLHFDKFHNPFPPPGSHNFQEMRQCFSQLRHKLNQRLHKSRSRIRLARRATLASALCVVGSTVAIAASAVVIATHALAAIVACPFCTTAAYLPANNNFLTRKEAAHVKQLDAAARGAYVLNNDLDTIDRLVARLYDAVESDRYLIRLGLERGKEVYTVTEVMKQVQRNQVYLMHQLGDLEEHICLCFNAVNRARSLLLQEIHLYQTPSSS